MSTMYAAVLDVVDAPDYVIGIILDPNENPYVSTYLVQIPEYYNIAPGYTWDGTYFISPNGDIVGVSPSGNCAVCLKSTGEVINIIVANPTDPWPDPASQLIEIPFGVFVGIGFVWNGSSFSNPNNVTFN